VLGHTLSSATHTGGRKVKAGVEAVRRPTLSTKHRWRTSQIDAVMEAQQDLADLVHTLRQVVCVKGWQKRAERLSPILNCFKNLQARRFHRRFGRQPWRDERARWFSSDRCCDVRPEPREDREKNARKNGYARRVWGLRSFTQLLARLPLFLLAEALTGRLR
jgi:hypothetical protein